MLLSADGIGTNEITRETGKSKTCVWRWQERFMQEGYDGLLRDKTRPSRIAPLGSQIAARVVTLTQTDPPAELTHWTAALMAKVVGISASSVQRIWRAHGLQPHRVQQFKLSTSCVTSSGSMSIHTLMRAFSRLMRNRKSRRLTAPSPAYR